MNNQNETVLSPRLIRLIVIALFLFSGATALVYEIIWVRYLGLVFGSTTYSITTVLAAFMGGLALGSLWIGRVADRIGQRPLRIYAMLEAGIGLFGLLSPLIFHFVLTWGPKLLPESMLLDASSGLPIKFAIGFVLLLIPTTLMGGSLPALSRFLIRHPDGIKRDLGMLYSINTLGAVAGAALAGFLLLFTLGLTGTLIATGIVNLLIAAAAWKLDLQSKIASTPEEAEDKGSDPDRMETGWMRKVLYTSFLISGGLAMAYEVIWSRLLVQVIGSSTYGFSMILIAYLTGLAGGSYLVSRFVPARWLHAHAFAALQIAIAAGAFLLIPLMAWMPEALLAVFEAGYDAYWQIAVASFLLVLLLVLPSTLCMGATFPVVAHMLTRSEGSLGSDIGRAYFFNTCGAILGTVLAGFVLLPELGGMPSMRLVITMNLLLALVVIWGAVVSSGKSDLFKSRMLISSMVLLALWPVWRADWSSGLSAVNVAVYGKALAQNTGGGLLGDLRFEQEGINARVTVRQAYDHRFLQVNGKADASTGTDMATQILFGLLPTLYHPKEGPTFMIGYGSGVTARVIAEERPDQQIDVAEIEDAVVEAGKIFADVNHGVETFSNVRMVRNDARNFLVGVDKKYSMIVSEPSNPWLAGIAGLFTSDFYQLASDHLTDDGVFVQWIQMYSLSPENTRMILRTLLDRFPYAEVWESIPSDLIVVASKRPLSLPKGWQQQLTRNSERWKEYSDRLWLYKPSDLLAHRRGKITGDVEGLSLSRNSDDLPKLEFTAPWSLYEDTLDPNREWLADFFPDGALFDEPEMAASRARYLAEGGLHGAADKWSRKGSREGALKGKKILPVALTRAKVLLNQGDAAGSVRQLEAWSDSKDVEVNLLLVNAQMQLGRVVSAKSSLRRIEQPEALQSMQYQQWCEAALALRMFHSVGSVSLKREEALGMSYRTRHYFGVIAYRKGELKQAEEYFRESLAINVHNGVTLAYLGHTLWKQARLKEAVAYYQRYVNYWGENKTISKRIKLVNSL
ncbi:MAG: fused MFS/spermidine synthase [Mariprofundaceae bacterium]